MAPFLYDEAVKHGATTRRGFRKLKSFIGYATREKEVYWRISQNPPLSGPFRLTTPHSCCSLILVAIVWCDLPAWIAICVVIMNLSDTNSSTIFLSTSVRFL